MTKIKPKKGWVIVKEERGQHSIEQAYYDEKLEKFAGVIGYGAIIRRKKHAIEIANELNESHNQIIQDNPNELIKEQWRPAKFYVKKAELRVVE